MADDRRREQRPRPRTAEPPRGQRANRGSAHPGKPAGRAGRGEHPRAAAREAPRPGLARKPDEPPVPEDVDIRALHRSVRAELRGLPKELGDIVAAHLLVAGQLIDDDPELAYAHAEAARRRAARLPIVREAAAETAYAAGRYDVALSEFRALRRMTGVDDYLPVMADCERALGRPDAALKLAKQARSLTLDPSLRAEMVMVEAGARSDLGQVAEALRILRAGVSASRPARLSRGKPRRGCGSRTRTRSPGTGRRSSPASGSRLPPSSTTSRRPTRRRGWTSWTAWYSSWTKPISTAATISRPPTAHLGLNSRRRPSPPPRSLDRERTAAGAEAGELAVIDSYDAALLDLDGVVYLGPIAVEGAPEAIARLYDRGVKIGFVTNNAARPPAAVAEHLRELGIPAREGDVVTAAQAAAHLLATRFGPRAKILVVGGDGILAALAEHDLTPVRSADDEPVAVIQGWAFDLTWEQLNEAAIAIHRGAHWVATNTDPTRPTDRGLVPGNGAAVAAVAMAVDARPEVAGKPYRPLLDETIERLGA